MFGLLKDKLSGFVNKLIKREESKETPSAAAEEKKEPVLPISKIEEKPAERAAPAIEKKKIAEPAVEKPKPAVVEERPKPAEDVKPKPFEEKLDLEEERKILEQKPIELEKIPDEATTFVEKKGVLSALWPFGKKTETPAEQVIQTPKPAAESQKPKTVETPKMEKPVPGTPKTIPHISTGTAAGAQVGTASGITSPATSTTATSSLDNDDLSRLEKRSMSDAEREMKVKMGLGKSVVGFFTPSVTVEENDVRDLLDELELALLESDVAMEVSSEVTQRLRTRLIGMKVPKGDVQAQVQKQMQNVLTEVMTSSTAFEFLSRVKTFAKPAKILFVGPNGAGKTTTMAKLAHKFMENGMTVVLSASDTFRAAAIEQTEVHGLRLKVPVVKSNYGADPASVAFDAVRYAQAHKIDVVLIDSAGRQDTNTNLLDELKKINRVVKPDLKIYIGESIGGHALMEQIRGFHDAIGIDGAILTKLDCDAKGGTAISLTYATGVPILFLGTGQKYEDLVAFDAANVAKQILT